VNGAARVLALASGLLLVVVGGACGSRTVPDPDPPVPAGTVLFADSFDRPDALVTNEYAYWNPGAADSVTSPDWETNSGSLFVRAGAAWTGVPDDRAPDAESASGTNSAVFRLTSTRGDFADVAVAFDLRVDARSTTPSTPPVDWDGVHVFLRYQDEESLYYASIDRRDGATAIKKKVPGGPSNGGTYHDLATGRHSAPIGQWQRVRATVGNQPDGSVVIRLFADDVLVASAVDHGAGGPPIRRHGKIGLRGDNTEFDVDNLRVTAL
jgi:hypothetical protein